MNNILVVMNKKMSRSEAETAKFAESIAQTARQGDIFCLTGPLGAGKTAFAKGFAMGLNVSDATYVVSPTFTLLNGYYSGRLPLYHFDVYRLSGAEELEGIGYEEYFYGNGVCLVEWADRVTDVLPSTAVWIDIAYGETDNERIITYSDGINPDPLSHSRTDLSCRTMSRGRQ